jgi:hypothetical protein
MDLTDIYIICHTTAPEYTLFSAVHGTFSKMYRILGHKVSVNKYKNIEVISCILQTQ